MKKITYIMFSLLVVALFGCNKVTYSDIEGDADARVDKQIKEWNDALIGSESGWFANIMTNKGIYRFWMKFEAKNQVTMYTDNLQYKATYLDVPETSTYRIEAYQLPTLIFDTYSYLSIINDPNNAISGGFTNHGLETDFEFDILTFDGEKFELRGRLNGVAASLTKATEQESAAVQQGRMMTQLEEISKSTNGKSMEFIINGKKVAAILRQRNLTTVILGDNNTLVKRTYTYTSMANNDIVFDTPFNIAGAELTGIKWDAASSLYKTIVDSNSKEYEITVVDNPSFALLDVFGVGKTFTRLRYFNDATLLSQMGTSATNPVNKGIKGAAGFIAALMGGSGLNLLEEVFTGGKFTYVDIYFASGEDEGSYDMVIDISYYLSSRLMPIEYKIKVIDRAADWSEFTLSGDVSDLSYNSNGEVFYENRLAAGSGFITPTKDFVNAFRGKKFKMQWSPARFNGELLAEFVCADGSRYVGGISE